VPPAGALLGPTLSSLRALLDGPAAARHRDVLLELLLTLPTRRAPRAGAPVAPPGRLPVHGRQNAGFKTRSSWPAPSATHKLGALGSAGRFAIEKCWSTCGAVWRSQPLCVCHYCGWWGAARPVNGPGARAAGARARRLSDMLQVLGRLMAPLVAALAAAPALVALALRTLEYWIDSLNPEFLEPVCAPVAPAMLLAIWGHLRPAPYPFGPKALQLLGKLGGRNRRFLRDPLALAFKANPEHGLRLILTFRPATSFLVPLDRCIGLARATLLPRDGPPADAAPAGAAPSPSPFRMRRRQRLPRPGARKRGLRT